MIKLDKQASFNKQDITFDRGFLSGEKIKEVKKNKQKNRLLSFLKKEGFLVENGQGYLAKKELLEDVNFKYRLNRCYLDIKNGKRVVAGLGRMRNLLGDLDVQDGVKLRDLLDDRLREKSPKEKTINILMKMGIIEQKNGRIVVDVEQLQSERFWKEHKVTISSTKKLKIKFTPRNVYKILGDLQVISKEDYKKAIQDNESLKTKALFNIPKNVEDAFDMENIKTKEYYLNVWTMYGTVPWQSIKIPTKDGNVIDIRELYIATKIFRDFQGQRDKKGVLKIFDKNKGKFIKISNEWLVNERVINTVKSMRKILLEDCPNLLASGLVKFDDFRLKTNTEEGRIFRVEKTAVNIKTNSEFAPMFNSVKYSMGRKVFIYKKERIPMENIKVVLLDPAHGGIVKIHKGREELIYTFDFLNKEEIKEKRQAIRKKYGKKIPVKAVTARVQVRKSEMNSRIKKYSPTEIVPMKEGEKIDEYGDRIANLPNYGYVQRVTKKFSEKIGVGIHNLTWREQLQIATMEYEKGVLKQDDEVVKFAKEHKLNGLKAFLSLEQGGLEMGEKILKIGERFEKEPSVAKAIFQKYAELVEVVEGVSDYLKEQFGKENTKRIQEIQENILRRGKAILVMFADKEMSMEDVLGRLKEINVSVDILITILKTMKKHGEKVNFEIIKNLKVEKRNIGKGQDLSEKEKNRIRQIFEDTYRKIFADNKEAYQRVMSSINTALNNLEGQTVYTMKYKDEIIAFCRFKKISETEVEGASLVTVENVQGLNVGEYFIDNVVKDMSKKYAILIKTRKNNFANKKNLEAGYEIVGEHTEQDGVEYYDMRMPAEKEVGLKKAA